MDMSFYVCSKLQYSERNEVPGLTCRQIYEHDIHLEDYPPSEAARREVQNILNRLESQGLIDATVIAGRGEVYRITYAGKSSVYSNTNNAF